MSLRNPYTPVTDLPTGAIAQTFERRSHSVLGLMSTGRLVISPIYLRAGQSVASITFSNSTSVIANPTHGWAALFNPSRGLMAQSADDTGITWASSVAKTFTLSSAQAITTDGWYFVGLCICAGTMPNPFGIALGYGYINVAPNLGGASTGSLTATAPSTADPGSGITNVIQYAYVSS